MPPGHQRIVNYMEVTEKSRQVVDPRRLELATDPHRPLYHFLSPANWMNDPNGAIFWDGRFHLFYQHNPHGAFWGTIHWGHAVTDDLVHWTDLPIALAPDPDGPDRSGCASGTAVAGADVPTLIYYGIPDGYCIATSDDDLVTWKKHPANPVIPHPPEGTEEGRAFDPCAWREGDEWYSLSGGQIEGVGDTSFLFRSDDLVKWDYIENSTRPGLKTTVLCRTSFRLAASTCCCSPVTCAGFNTTSVHMRINGSSRSTMAV